MLALVVAIASAAVGASQPVTPHLRTADFPVCEDAWVHGYEHNKINDNFEGRSYATLCIQCTNAGVHLVEAGDPDRFFSCWTRDIYWGGLGWSQAGGGEVLDRVRTTIELLIICKNHNKAQGQNKSWPLNDGRHYIPQAFCKGVEVAKDFYPYNSESQADFVMICRDYWKINGDTAFIRSIWDDIAYVVETIRLMDTNGNTLPDALWGSYDYQGLGLDTEEPLMCAKAAAAYQAASEMAAKLDKADYAKEMASLANRVRETMNRHINHGGLWNGRYFVNKRGIGEGRERIDDRFIPYENLVPIFCGGVPDDYVKSIFDHLDSHFDEYYPLKWGPMYTAPAAKNEKSVLSCSTTVWLGFLDVYLRCRHGHEKNRSGIFQLLLDHAYDIPAAPFTEGAGIFGNLTGGAGRAWDNGNFFHCLISGVYGIEKSAAGFDIAAPTRMDGHALSELRGVPWRDALIDFEWRGEGRRIAKVEIDGMKVSPWKGFVKPPSEGTHKITVTLGN